jgi:hypothetical protein
LALVLQADGPEEAAAYVLGYLPKHIEFAFAFLRGGKRRRVLEGFEAVRRVEVQTREHNGSQA